MKYTKCLRCPSKIEENQVFCDVCLEKELRMGDIEKACEEVWDLWRVGELSDEEVQGRLEEILGPEPKGFFKDLNDLLTTLVQNNISEKAKQLLNVEAYFNKLESIQSEVIEKTNWSDFWLNCEWLKTPTEEDLETLINMDDAALADFHIIICMSLKQLAEQNSENSEQAQALYEFYKLTKREINSRITMPRLPDKDAFNEFIQNKQGYIAEHTKMERARKTGDFCPHCGGSNVRSYNKEQWKCYNSNCGKRFRKHQSLFHVYIDAK